MIIRTCTTCGLTASDQEQLKMFKRDIKSVSGYRNKCKQCFNDERRVGRYKKEGQYYTPKRKRQNKVKAVQYKGSKCQSCGVQYDGTNASIFDFHHVDPAQKEATPTRLMSSTWERIVEEIDKCVLLCANCHRLEHHASY